MPQVLKEFRIFKRIVVREILNWYVRDALVLGISGMYGFLFWNQKIKVKKKIYFFGEKLLGCIGIYRKLKGEIQ